MPLEHQRKSADVDGGRWKTTGVNGAAEWKERVATLITQWGDVDWLSASIRLNILLVDISIYSDLSDWGESGQTEQIDRTVTVVVTLQWDFLRPWKLDHGWWFQQSQWAFFKATKKGSLGANLKSQLNGLQGQKGLLWGYLSNSKIVQFQIIFLLL